MTADEFADFIDQCRVLFSYVNRLAESDDGPARLAVWQSALSTVSKADAERYATAMVQGDVPVPEYPSEWDGFPGRLRQWVKLQAEPRYYKATGGPKDRATQSHIQAELRRHGFADLADQLARKQLTKQ